MWSRFLWKEDQWDQFIEVEHVGGGRSTRGPRGPATEGGSRCAPQARGRAMVNDFDMIFLADGSDVATRLEPDKPEDQEPRMGFQKWSGHQRFLW